MDKKQRTQKSKFLSYVLRHEPQSVGLQLDEQGWALVSELLDKCNQHGNSLSLAELRVIVEMSPKRRFAFSVDDSMIRASQGHSVGVDLGYPSEDPPEVLFHGTGSKWLPAIREQGLKRMARHHVHLSSDRETASVVGQRRGKPVIIEVAARAMARSGHEFYVSDNGVWLVDAVPPEYLTFPES